MDDIRAAWFATWEPGLRIVEGVGSLAPRGPIEEALDARRVLWGKVEFCRAPGDDGTGGGGTRVGVGLPRPSIVRARCVSAVAIFVVTVMG
jgi:hypothetical protein